MFQTEPPATVRPSGSGLSDAMVDYAGVSGHEAQALGDEAAGDIAGETLRTGPLPGPGLSAPGQSETSQFASTPVGNAVPLSQETSSAESDVVVPPAEGPTEARRLPIFEAVESNWFRGGRTVPGSSGVTAAAGSRWASPADEGWHAAETVDSPSSGGQTTAGLPKRLPNANLVPGAIPERATRRAETVSCRDPRPARQTPARCQPRPGRCGRSGRSWRRRRVLTPIFNASGRMGPARRDRPGHAGRPCWPAAARVQRPQGQMRHPPGT